MAAVVALIAAGILGNLAAGGALRGSSNAGVITVAAMLVIAKGVLQTGVSSRVTWALLSSTTTSQQTIRRAQRRSGWPPR